MRVQIPHKKGQFWGEGSPIVEYGDFAVSCAETAEMIDLPFGLWTRVGRRKHKFSRIRQVAPTCPHVTAHWRHLENRIEPSVCGGDAVLQQISVTTCYYYYVKRYQTRMWASAQRDGRPAEHSWRLLFNAAKFG